MCGIAGFVKLNGNLTEKKALEIGVRMRDSLFHRGPDNGGIYYNSNPQIVLTHRRLSILDLSEKGNQPMISSSGRWVMVFNGEIYNHLVLRKNLNKLSRINWQSRSDTETLLELIENYGLSYALESLIGMFAFAVLDTQSSKLFMAVDRFGEKPLYYGKVKDSFLFSSDAGAFKHHPDFSQSVNLSALSGYLRLGYVSGPESIYKGINRLLPGHFLEVDLNKNAEIERYEKYWDLEAEYSRSVSRVTKREFINVDSQVNVFQEIIEDAVKDTLISDAPLGAFLSGGIDSSLVVAIANRHAGGRLKTFNIGFNESQYDESKYAADVAGHLGTDHTSIIVSPEDCLNVITKLPEIYTEPFGDLSAIPTYLVAKLAKQQVKVCLSGDGGDEIFGGYNHYFVTKPDTLWALKSSKIGNLATSSANKLPREIWDCCMSIGISSDKLSLTNRIFNKYSVEHLMRYAQGIFSASDFQQYYYNLLSRWNYPPLKDGRQIEFSGWRLSDDSIYKNRLCAKMLIDSITYLPYDIMVKVDRASMYNSLECRAPLLNHNIIENSLRLQSYNYVGRNTKKIILKKILEKYIPKSSFDRPKMGFGVPVDIWLRGPLKEWATEVLNYSPETFENPFDDDAINRRFEQHITGVYNYRDSLWTVLMAKHWMMANKL